MKSAALVYQERQCRAAPHSSCLPSCIGTAAVMSAVVVHQEALPGSTVLITSPNVHRHSSSDARCRRASKSKYLYVVTHHFIDPSRSIGTYLVHFSETYVGKKKQHDDSLHGDVVEEQRLWPATGPCARPTRAQPMISGGSFHTSNG